MLTTAFTRRFGVVHPLIQAGMGEAGPEIVLAVCGAGGLGSLGTIGKNPDQVAGEIAAVRGGTSRPFAVNVVTWDWAPFAGKTLDVVLEAGAPVVTLSFGDPLPGLTRCRAAGVLTIVQAQDMEVARAAIAAGADLVVAQGNEAGGHTGRRGTLSFAAEVLEAAGETPVGVAGGIASGRAMSGVLAMWAAVAVVGTRFKATVEYPASDQQKQEIVAASGADTLYDEINDEAYSMTWPRGVTGRAIRNRFTAEWEERHAELKAAVAAAPRPFGFVRQLAQAGTSVNWGGESAGLVRAVQPAADVVAEMVREAEEQLRAAATLLTGPGTAA
ncbi:MAG: nitronate monooxygenase [Dehalococcoidia bacterium]|nr:nitronate monooxygenase [Dehalococcoidia bacterium]